VEAETAGSAFNALNDQHKEHPLGETSGKGKRARGAGGARRAGKARPDE